MPIVHSIRRLSLCAVAALLLLTAQAGADPVGNLGLVNKELVATGRLPADLRDKFGETFDRGQALRPI